MTSRDGEWQKFAELCSATPAIGPGARYISVEFHCHTPASNDFRVRGAEGYRGIAKQLHARNVDAVFVTDHNAWEGIANLQAAVRDLRVSTVVYPGVELTIEAEAARVGDGLTKEERKIKPYIFHCLVLLPPSDQAAKQIETLVTNNFRDSDILKREPTERKLQMSLSEVADLVHNWNGLLLIAHFHQGKAPDKSRSHDDIYTDALAIQHLHEFFDAVEIRDVSQARFFDGLQKGTNSEVIPEKVCVLGSDAHDPAEVGVEQTWLLVEDNTFEDIRTSLRYRERVLFQAPHRRKDVLQHLVIEGTFLGHFHFAFSNCLTALIGTKGAGKSAILECIRFVLGVAPAQDMDKYLNHILGPSGRVWLSVTNRTDEQFLFVRSRSEPVPRVVAASGAILERSAVIPANFPVEIRGWGEVTRLSEDKGAQLKLLDAFDDSGRVAELSASIRDVRATLGEAFTTWHTTLDKLKETKTELDQLALKKERLAKLVIGKMVTEQVAKEKRDSEVASYRELARVLKEDAASQVALMSTESGEQIKSLRVAIEQGDLTPNAGAIASAAITEAVSLEGNLIANATAGKAALASAIEECVRILEEEFRPLEERYQELFANLDPNEQDVLLARNEIVQEIAHLPALQGRYDQLAKEVEGQLREYADRCDNIQAALTERSAKRSTILDTLNKRLAEAGIGTRLTVESHRVMKGNLPSGVQAATVFGATGAFLRGLDASQAMQRYYDLVPMSGPRPEASLEIDDSPAIEFELYPGVWRPSEQLSAGQKSTAVLPLIIMLGEGPLILDQPEDNLDNKYIGSVVVRMVLKEKARRQFVVTSHNATLVVMSDADLVIEMTDKEGKAQILDTGFLNGPHSKVRRAVLEVLDGGEGALRRRFSKYGLNAL